MPPYNTKPVDMSNMDISFDLHRLFDPYNFDHIPEHERMDEFPQRNMAHIRNYKAAVKFFGGPHSRKRIIVAPKMETPMRHRMGEYLNKKDPPPAPELTLDVKPKQELSALSPPPPQCLIDAKLEAAKLEEHQKWIHDRKKLRADLNSMGLTQDYLKRKPNRTALENLLLDKLIKGNSQIQVHTPPAVETHVEPDLGKPVPKVKLPSPKALKVLDQFIQDKKMRLIDLFTSVDKDKNWTISREEFKKAMKENKVPLSDDYIEDLILALDTNCSNELDFRELSKGMAQFKRERRVNRRIELSEAGSVCSSKSSKPGPRGSPSPDNGDEDNVGIESRPHSRLSHSVKATDNDAAAKRQRSGSANQRTSSGSQKRSPPISVLPEDQEVGNVSDNRASPQSDSPRVTSPERTLSGQGGVTSGRQTPSPSGKRGHRTGSGKKPSSGKKSESGSRASTPSQLEVPEFDLRPEQFVLASDEAMVDHIKVTRCIGAGSARTQQGVFSDGLKYPNVIKTGDKAIDDHSMFSQLEGEVGDRMNSFRQEKLREYYSVRALCQSRGVSLTKELLDKVLLYPPDKPHGVIMKEIKRRQGNPLLSAKFAHPAKKKIPLEVKHKDKVKRSRSGRLLIDTRLTFPRQHWLNSKGRKMTLSTGRAFIKSATDCWMSFEEYERLTSHLEVRYQQIHGRVNYNAFWPGYLLDKLRLCMPPYDTNQSNSIGSGVIFHHVKQGQRTNHGYNNDLNTYPVDSKGCVKYGDVDPFIRKPLVL